MITREDWEIESAAARERLRARDRKHLSDFLTAMDRARLAERLTKAEEFADDARSLAVPRRGIGAGATIVSHAAA